MALKEYPIMIDNLIDKKRIKAVASLENSIITVNIDGKVYHDANEFTNAFPNAFIISDNITIQNYINLNSYNSSGFASKKIYAFLDLTDSTSYELYCGYSDNTKPYIVFGSEIFIDANELKAKYPNYVLFAIYPKIKKKVLMQNNYHAANHILVHIDDLDRKQRVPAVAWFTDANVFVSVDQKFYSTSEMLLSDYPNCKISCLKKDVLDRYIAAGYNPPGYECKRIDVSIDSSKSNKLHMVSNYLPDGSIYITHKNKIYFSPTEISKDYPDYYIIVGDEKYIKALNDKSYKATNWDFKRKGINMSLPVDIIKKVKDLAKKNNSTVSKTIEDILVEHFK